MHQQKRIGSILAIVLLFLMAGGWYLWRYSKPEETDEIKGILAVTPTIEEALPTAAELPTVVPVQEERIAVFLCGEVVCPGVYELSKDGRLYEVIEQAGGFTQQADKTYHNLARQVEDGERIYILSQEETKELALLERIAGEEELPDGMEERTKRISSLINLNTATIQELTTLPGIGEAKAESIIEYRSQVGNFMAIEEVMNISGIGEAMFEKMKDKITVK